MKLDSFFKKYKEKIIDVLILISIYLFLLSFFKPSLILSSTTTSGGDTGSHNYLAHYTKNYLLPHGKLIGWSPDWYAGFPIFQYYFALPYLVMSLLSFLIPLNIAFKLVTIAGTFLLPLAAYFAMKFFDFKFPAPIIAASLTLPFLFMEANSMWGGNIPSTLAGEFSYSISFALTILFLGSFYYGIKNNKGFVANAILFSLISLTHIYTGIFAGLSSLFLLLGKNKKQIFSNFKYFIKCYGLSFLLISFWIIPLFFKLQYRTPLNYVWDIGDIKQVFPEILWPTLFLSGIGIIIGLKNKDNRIAFLFMSLLISALLYTIGPSIGLADIRFVTFIQIVPALIAAYMISYFLPKMKINSLIVIVIAVLILIWTNEHVNYIDFWIKWNYEGFESKSTYPQLKELTEYMRSLPSGRIAHEYSPSHDRFGTPRAFEMFPVFSGKPVLEGLTIESAVSSPYVFILQSEISEKPTCPIPGLKCSSFDINIAAKHLKLFNVNYLVVTSDKAKTEVRTNGEFTFLKSFNEIEVYRVNNDGKHVALPSYEPVVFETDDWKNKSIEWFQREDLIDIPLVFDKNAKNDFKLTSNDLNNIPKVELENDCSIEEEVKNEEIFINTTCIGKPLLVKMSYSPNWKVDGAKGVYLASPSFMMIIPNQKNVRLYYGDTVFDVVGKLLSILGIGIIVGGWCYNKFVKHLIAV